MRLAGMGMPCNFVYLVESIASGHVQTILADKQGVLQAQHTGQLLRPYYFLPTDII